MGSRNPELADQGWAVGKTWKSLRLSFMMMQVTLPACKTDFGTFEFASEHGAGRRASL